MSSSPIWSDTVLGIFSHPKLLKMYVAKSKPYYWTCAIDLT